MRPSKGIATVLYPDILILLNRYGNPQNESKSLKASPTFFKSNQFNNCQFFLPNYFITLFSCLASKSS